MKLFKYVEESILKLKSKGLGFQLLPQLIFGMHITALLNQTNLRQMQLITGFRLTFDLVVPLQDFKQLHFKATFLSRKVSSAMGLAKCQHLAL